MSVNALCSRGEHANTMFELEKEHTMFLLFHSIFEILNIFKEYLKLLNRLYDITWFGSVYEAVYKKGKLTQ